MALSRREAQLALAGETGGSRRRLRTHRGVTPSSHWRQSSARVWRLARARGLRGRLAIKPRVDSVGCIGGPGMPRRSRSWALEVLPLALLRVVLRISKATEMAPVSNDTETTSISKAPEMAPM